MALVDQLLEQAQARDLFGRIQTLAALRALRIRQTVAALPDAQRFYRQTRQARSCAGSVHDRFMM